MTIVGVDPALSNTGVCYYYTPNHPAKIGGKVAPESIRTDKKLSDFDRQLQAVEELDVLGTPKNVLVLMEDFSMSTKFQPSGKSSERLELCGMLKYVWNKKGYPLLLVHTSHLKSFICGKASARKDDVRKVVDEVWGVPTKNLDESDATSLALIGAGLLGWIPDLDKKKLGVLAKVAAYRENASVLFEE
jgi:Holliday junction resolvasome RuvABC endonuclease subunit